jgi:hypothetical protein
MDLQQLIDYNVTGNLGYVAAYQAMLGDIRLVLAIRPEQERELLQAMRIIRARMEYSRLLASVGRSNWTSRLVSFWRIIKSAKSLAVIKSLGTKLIIKAGILSVSPTAYYRLQQRWWRWKFAR